MLVHRKPLLEQWVTRLGEFVDLGTEAIGTIGGGRGKPTGRVDVAMVQSLARHKTLDDLLARYGQIVIDEYPRLDTLVLAMPIAWKGTVTEYVGRLHRSHPGKHDVVVYDYVDAEVPVLRRMFAKRLRTYRTLGYELAET